MTVSRYLVLPTLLALVACDLGDSARTVTAGVVGSTVEATKGVADGVKDGIQDGRKNAESTDGSTVLSTPEEIAAATTLSVHAVEPGAAGGRVVLAVENGTDKPVHLIGLGDDGGALVVDTEGFATPLRPVGSGTIVAPPLAKVKATLAYDGSVGAVARVRVWGQELDAPALAASSEPAQGSLPESAATE